MCKKKKKKKKKKEKRLFERCRKYINESSLFQNINVKYDLYVEQDVFSHLHSAPKGQKILYT